jgi:hypothetical protein
MLHTYGHPGIPPIWRTLRKKLDANTHQRDRTVKRAQTRLTRLNHERDKLLHAYYRELIDDDQFKAEQERIKGEIADATDALADQEIKFTQVEKIVTRALELAADCQGAYARAPDELRQKMNQLFFKRLEVDLDGIARTELTDEMSILIGEEIAPRFQRAGRELAYTSVGSSPNGNGRDRELVSLAVGSSNEPLVEVRGVEPGGADGLALALLASALQGPKTSVLAQMPALLGLQSVCSLGRNLSQIFCRERSRRSLTCGFVSLRGQDLNL